MRRLLLTPFLALVCTQPALAQTVSQGMPMSLLIRNGFEIKAAAPNGSQYVVFLQKDRTAYACVFVTVSNTQCRVINQGSQ